MRRIDDAVTEHDGIWGRVLRDIAPSTRCAGAAPNDRQSFTKFRRRNRLEFDGGE